MSILSGLNEQQKRAVLKQNGPLLIIAGAGSGKTKTIAHRIAYLISKGVPADKILAVTFTNKAALEMKERIMGLLKKEGDKEPYVGTFHALGAHILRIHGSHIGIPKHFSIFDEEDVRRVLKELVGEFELDPDAFAPLKVRAQISRLKNELVSADAFLRESGDSPYQKKLGDLYVAYEIRLQKMRAVDFDDLLLKSVMVIESHKEVKTHWQEKWSHIHIDEYQDTNRAQYVLSKLLAEKSKNIAVVGDVDQSIYSWRGADFRNILQFEFDWPGAEVITLEENYRSTQKILEAANSVIVHNTERREKRLTSQNEEGEAIVLAVLEDEKQEASFIAEYILSLKAGGVSFGSVAVLFRTNAQSRAIEEAFLKKNIPYHLIAGVKFYERKEVKDILAYVKYAQNPSDLLSKKRILNTPPRGIGKVLSLKYLGGQTLSRKEKDKIISFENIIKKIEHASKTQSAFDTLKITMREAGFERYYKGNKPEEDRLENIKELLSVAKKFDNETPPEGIQKLLTEASLSTQETEVEEKNSSVTLLTAHAAKGLEFDIIIVAGMEEGIFPHALSRERHDLEEERRLFYVALTRARNTILLTLTRHRMLYGEMSYNDPSRFLGEIPEHLLAGADLVSGENSHEEEIQI